MDLDSLPPVDQPLERLRVYQREREKGLETERRRVAAVLSKRDIGEKLSTESTDEGRGELLTR